MQTKSKKFVKGFTLIELLIVIAILALLASFVIVVSIGRGGTARDGIRKAHLRQLSDYLRGYYYDHGFTYPAGGPYFSTDADPWIPGLDDYNKPLPKDPRQASLINSLAGNFKMLLSNENIIVSRIISVFNDIKPQVKVVYADSFSDQQFTASSNDAYIQSYTSTPYGDTASPPTGWPPDPPAPIGSGICTGTGAGLTTARFGQWRNYPGGPSNTQNNAYRYFLEFDTSAIPANATITSAKITLFMQTDNSQTNFDINVREFNYSSVVDCADWDFLGGTPVNETYNTAVLQSQPMGYPIDLIFSSGGRASIKKGIGAKSNFGLSSSREEDNNIIPNQTIHEDVSIYTQNYATVSLRPILTVSYTTPGGGGPGPGDPGYGICGEDPKVFCYAYYYNSIGDNTYTLWTNMERDDDKQIYSGELATCRENPPLGKTYFDYCTK